MMPHRSQEEKKATRIAKMLAPIITIWLALPLPIRYALMVGSGVGVGGPVGNLLGGGHMASKLDSTLMAVRELRGAFLEMPGADSAMSRYHRKQSEFQRQIELYGAPTAAIETPSNLATIRTNP